MSRYTLLQSRRWSGCTGPGSFQCYWLFTHFLLYSPHRIFLSGQHLANVGTCVWRRRQERFYGLAITWHGGGPIWGKIIYHKKLQDLRQHKIPVSRGTAWISRNLYTKNITILYTSSNFSTSVQFDYSRGTANGHGPREINISVVLFGIRNTSPDCSCEQNEYDGQTEWNHVIWWSLKVAVIFLISS